MSRQDVAYAAYALGSAIFVFLAIQRGSPLLALGSALFLLGTLLFLVPRITRRWRDGTRPDV